MRRLFILLSFLVVTSDKIFAQCAMCKGAAETSLEAGNAQAAGINAGVLYVLVIVSIILGGFAYLIWKYKNADGMYQ